MTTPKLWERFECGHRIVDNDRAAAAPLPLMITRDTSVDENDGDGSSDTGYFMTVWMTLTMTILSVAI